MAKPTDAEIGAMFLGEAEESPVEEAAGEQLELVESQVDNEEIVSDEVPDDDTPTEVDEPELVSLEYDGVVYEAPEAFKTAIDLANDYTQKTQAVSAQRKQYEVGLGQIAETQKAYEFAKQVQAERLEITHAGTLIQQYEQHLAENVRNMTSADITAVQMEIKNLERFAQNKEAELQNKQTEFQQAQEQSLQELLTKSTEVIRSTVPTWSDKHESILSEYGQSLGFTEQELQSLVDPRQKIVLWKASQYDKLQDGRAAAVKTAKTAPSIKAKSHDPMPQDAKDRLKFRKDMQSSKLSPAEKRRRAEQRFGASWS